MINVISFSMYVFNSYLCVKIWRVEDNTGQRPKSLLHKEVDGCKDNRLVVLLEENNGDIKGSR